MAFILNDEQLIIKETIRDFVQKECPRETAREMEAEETIPFDLWHKLAELGFLGLTIPEDYGGEGISYLGGLITIEELSRMFPSFAITYIGSAFTGGGVIAALGDENQKKEYLDKLTGGGLHFSTALAEEEAGFKVDGLKTFAELNGEKITVNGSKNRVSSAGFVNYLIALVRSGDKDDPDSNLSVLIVDVNSPGVELIKKDKIGMKSAGSYQVNFNQVNVPAASILGGNTHYNRGAEQLPFILDMQNLAYAACRLGIADGAYEYARNHAHERVQFGLPIIEFNAIKKMLVELAVEIDACRLLVYRAGSLADAGKPFSLEAGMAASSAMRLVKNAVSRGIQVCGGYGYALEYDAQRYWRDAFAAPFDGQTAETIDRRTALLAGL